MFKDKTMWYCFFSTPHVTVSHLAILTSIAYINHSIRITTTTTPSEQYITQHLSLSFSSFIILSSVAYLLFLQGKMAILMPRIIQAKQILRRSLSNERRNRYFVIPKGYFVVYVGEQEKKRFVLPVLLLSQPEFQELLCQAEEEYGYNHPMGGLTVRCSKDTFIDLASRLGALWLVHGKI